VPEKLRREDTMILDALGQVLGQAAGIILSPLPIVAVILMLFTARSKVDSLSFLVGWMAGLAIVGAVVLSLSDAADVTSNSDASNSSGGVSIGLGVLCIVIALRHWRKRPRPGEHPDPPKWMARIDGLGPVAALALGAALAALNPKNLILAVSAALVVGQQGLSAEDTVVTWAIFVVIASIGIALPVLYRLIRGERAQASLDSAKVWLQEHNSVVVAVIFLVIGAKILGEGLSTVS
jgi:hypothetical protein